MKKKILLVLIVLFTITGCTNSNVKNDSNLEKANDNASSAEVDVNSNIFTIGNVSFTFNIDMEYHDFIYKMDEKLNVNDSQFSRTLQYENDKYAFKIVMSYEVNKRLDDVAGDYNGQSYNSKTINGLNWIFYSSDDNVVYLIEKNYNLYKISFNKDKKVI